MDHLQKDSQWSNVSFTPGVWLQTLFLNGRHPETNAQVMPEFVIQKAVSGVTVF